ncbi:MAG: response regulator, partial [Halobacteriovoraceae bacterium]|nr:response regulator [Halobacteriovoraceae bacterium]
KDFLIVCVDDDKDVLDVTVAILEDLGYQSVAFSLVEEAVEYIRENRQSISIILSDLRMDNINGFEFKKILQSFASEIPFVIVTGYWTKEMSAEAMATGVDAFVEKPITIPKLEEHIETFAAQRVELLIEEREMVEGFLEETSPMLDEIESLILELEEGLDPEQTLSVYFRLLHTIKGTASCVGLTILGKYTHEYEDFIGELRNKKFPVNTQTTNILLQGLDDLRVYFTHVEKKGSDLSLVIEDKLKVFSSYNPAIDSTSTTKEETGIEKKEIKDVKEVKKEDKMSISMGVLDAFMEESGELTVIRNTISKTVKQIETRYRGDAEIELLNELLDGMYSVTSNIQGKITEMRKVPLQTTFRPFKRLIRDTSKKLGKEVNFEIEGEELAVDNIIAKLYNNTLIHLLRNSLDHGLETPEVRESVGKDPVGQLKIKIFEEADFITLEIHDDGKGVDPEIIRKIALSKGLYTEKELAEKSELETINILFDSGFSTAEQVSDLSGRGVGMDMVRSSFEDMGGNIIVKSEVGVGSTFILTVPVPKSVLIVNTLSTVASNENFIFYMDDVSEVIYYQKETENSKKFTIDGKSILSHNGEMIELIPLCEVLGLDEPSELGDALSIVVLRVGTNRFGIIVDEIHEFEEVVSRSICKQIQSSKLFHGASLLGSSEVAMILSAEGIANHLHLTLENNVLEELAIVEDEKPIDEFMLFTYAPEEFLCVHLEDVERLEKIESSRVEQIG